MRPGGGTSRITDNDSTDLPQPDSPTMPSVRPRPTEMSTPSTAATSPPPVRNTVRREEIASRGKPTPSPLAGQGWEEGAPSPRHPPVRGGGELARGPLNESPPTASEPRAVWPA